MDFFHELIENASVNYFLDLNYNHKFHRLQTLSAPTEPKEPKQSIKNRSFLKKNSRQGF